MRARAAPDAYAYSGWLPAGVWWRDLCDYYGVTAAQALVLGKRSPGRRPLLLGGGRTFEEIWHESPRETPAEVAAFYAELGPWLTFRQCYRHRRTSFRAVAADLPAGSRLLEFGCGVAPVAWWLARRRPGLDLMLVDVPSQPLDFAAWRLARLRSAPTLHLRYASGGEFPPLGSPYAVVCAFEVFEHLPHPVDALDRLLDALRAGGAFWEDFAAHEPGVADLAAAQEARPAFYSLLRKWCVMTRGLPPETPGGGGVRRWVVR